MNPKGYILPLVLAAVIGTSLWWQVRSNARLRGEQTRLTERAAEVARLRTLKERSQTTAVSPAELQRLDGDAIEAAALRDRINKLQETLAQPLPVAPVAPKKIEERWRNLGQATPANTLHSVVWAAMGGEVDALVSMLAYDPETRAAVDDLFASIPPESRAYFPTADKLIATLVAGRLPTDLTEAQVIEQTEETSDSAKAKVRLRRGSSSTAAPREVTFQFQRTGSDWRLVVPKSEIAAYRRVLDKK